MAECWKQRNELEVKRMKHEMGMQLLRNGGNDNVASNSNVSTNKIILNIFNQTQVPVREA